MCFPDLSKIFNQKFSEPVVAGSSSTGTLWGMFYYYYFYQKYSNIHVASDQFWKSLYMARVLKIKSRWPEFLSSLSSTTKITNLWSLTQTHSPHHVKSALVWSNSITGYALFVLDTNQKLILKRVEQTFGAKPKNRTIVSTMNVSITIGSNVEITLKLWWPVVMRSASLCDVYTRVWFAKHGQLYNWTASQASWTRCRHLSAYRIEWASNRNIQNVVTLFPGAAAETDECTTESAESLKYNHIWSADIRLFFKIK